MVGYFVLDISHGEHARAFGKLAEVEAVDRVLELQAGKEVARAAGFAVRIEVEDNEAEAAALAFDGVLDTILDLQDSRFGDRVGNGNEKAVGAKSRGARRGQRGDNAAGCCEGAKASAQPWVAGAAECSCGAGGDHALSSWSCCDHSIITGQ